MNRRLFVKSLALVPALVALPILGKSQRSDWVDLDCNGEARLLLTTKSGTGISYQDEVEWIFFRGAGLCLSALVYVSGPKNLYGLAAGKYLRVFKNTFYNGESFPASIEEMYDDVLNIPVSDFFMKHTGDHIYQILVKF